jgi:hypothetical protein
VVEVVGVEVGVIGVEVRVVGVVISFTVQSIKRLCMQCSSLEVQLEHGGLPISPPYLRITMFHRANFILPSVHITYLWVCSAAS